MQHIYSVNTQEKPLSCKINLVKKLRSQNRKEPSLAFGGQALIEGVMMRSRKHMVLCVRKPNQDIITQVEKLNPLSDKYKVLSLPFLRGIAGLFESSYLGIKGLLSSANLAFEDEKAEGESIKLGYTELAIIALGTLGMVAFFFLTPFLLYLTLIATWGQFHRVLQYHGAEHKAINAQEAGAPLDVANVKKFSRLHPRCGTSFLFIILIVSIILFSILPNLGFAEKIAYRILLIPVIAGVSYELLRLSGKYRNSPIFKILIAPGLGFQLLTTKEPSDDMLEVSIKAVQEVTKLTNT